MKKKGPRSIPYFSAKPKGKQVPEADASVKQPHAPVTTRNIKPQATSAKSGRRGG